MYDVDERDRVEELGDFPQSDPGAPMPLVLADEHSVVLSYYVAEPEPDYMQSFEAIAIVRFKLALFHSLGGPNDEALSGHPLWGRGLEHYAAHRVLDSSLIRRLEQMNRVHEHHNPERFWSMTHYVLTFHDSTFECVAESVTMRVEMVEPGQRLAAMAAEL